MTTVAALHSIPPCFIDSSQSGINQFSVCINRNANRSFGAANLDIWISRALFTICTALTDSVGAGFNKTTQRDTSKNKNGFSVMLNKQKGRGVNTFTDSAAFDLEHYTGNV